MPILDMDTFVKRALDPYFQEDELVTRLDTIAGLDFYIVQIYRDGVEIGGFQFSKQMLDRDMDYIANLIGKQAASLAAQVGNA